MTLSFLLPKPFLRLAAVLLCLSALLMPAFGEKKHSDPGPHPLRILKVLKDNSGSSFNQSKGDLQIWLQNAVDADVDQVKIEVEFYSKGGRYVDKVVKEVGIVKASSKSFQTVRWNIVGEEILVPKIWIYYNAGAERLTMFEAEPPVW
jgi:hypothetical protein